MALYEIGEVVLSVKRASSLVQCRECGHNCVFVDRGGRYILFVCEFCQEEYIMSRIGAESLGILEAINYGRS